MTTNPHEGGAEPKRGRGRPPTGEPIMVRLPEDQIAWLDSQGRRPDVIRRLIADAMAKP